MSSERRVATRQKSFLRGCVHFNNRRCAMDCLIRDISATGARLIFPDKVSLPAVIDLYIPHKEQTLKAEVHWRHGDEVGIAFPNAGARAGRSADAELADRMQRLEAEVAVLKKALKRLRADVDGRAEEAA